MQNITYQVISIYKILLKEDNAISISRRQGNEAKFDGPLHECSIYGNKDAGEDNPLWQWVSVPWQDAFENLTGSRELSGKSILNYYALKDWLDEQNKERTCGWN